MTYTCTAWADEPDELLLRVARASERRGEARDLDIAGSIREYVQARRAAQAAVAASGELRARVRRPARTARAPRRARASRATARVDGGDDGPAPARHDWGAR